MPPHLYKTSSFFRQDYMFAGGSLLLPPWVVLVPSNLFSLPTKRIMYKEKETMMYFVYMSAPNLTHQGASIIT
jgi:hypothetical protein